MCGICGVLDYGNVNPLCNESLLTSMSDSLVHRGPDDAGVFLSPDRRTGLGFRRLAIVDLSPAGHQPMSTPDGDVTIIFNGEIYNHQVLREEFGAKGYRYRSRSDTESILYAYKEYGADFVHKLLGIFALALWDHKKGQLVLARDRIGVKPLYYTSGGGCFVFGSEIKALFRHPSVGKELNREALYDYLTFLVPPAPLTMFKGIAKLEPGHLLVVRKDGSIEKTRYWDTVPEGPQPSIAMDGRSVAQPELLSHAPHASEEEHIRTIRSMLKQSIKDRMMSDVPFGVFLSGGIDSSTNVALMAELMDRPVDTFSVGFRDLEKYNELGYARQIAQQFKTNHHEVMIDQKDAFEFLPKLVYHQDEPLADPVCIPLYFVSKLARDNGTIVVQVGEGSDEQFAGYSWMLRELRFYRTFWKAYRALPDSIRRAGYRLSSGFLRRRGSYLVLDYIRKAAEGNELFWGGAVNFTENHKKVLLGEGWGVHSYDTHRHAQEWPREVLRRDPGSDYLKRMIYLEFRNRLPELLLMRVDKVSMATSIEARVPFLDHRMVEYSMAIPDRWKIKDGVPKYILKKAVEGILPDSIIYRRKQGFAAPTAEWLRTSWYSFAEDRLLNSSLVKQGLFRSAEITSLLRNHRDGKRNNGQYLWNLLNLVLWHEAWFNG